jgi:hypothetical protein
LPFQVFKKQKMVNRNLIKLLIVILIGFATIFVFSSLSAQTRPSVKEFIEFDEPFGDIYPADTLYDGRWEQSQIRYGWRDSLRKVLTDSAFFHALPLVGRGIGTYVAPFEGKVTSRFGPRRYRYHYGIDLNLNTGDTVVAAFDGRVRLAAYYSGYGYTVVIRHYNGLETLYGHFSKLLVDTNQTVKAGDPIGLGGNTGRSYGSHLHFEVRYLGIPFNPEFVINFDDHKLLNDTLFLSTAQFKYMGGGSASPSGSSPAVANYYKVKPGDNLSVIAKRHGTTVTRLCQLNNISRTTTLQVGRRLRVK